MGKICIWFLSFKPYFNLVHNISILSIIFQCHVNLVSTAISWMEIANMANRQNKKFVYCHINGNIFFILAVNHISNFYTRDSDKN